jgi:thiamine-phosphate pyrophosphorylase
VTLCLVTDRRRLAGAGTPFEVARKRLVEHLCRAADAGVDLIQIRERDLDAADLAAIVTDVLEGTRAVPTRVVVNDRLDVALACGAGGVHLRADSMSVGAARRLAPPGFTVGRSVHSVQEALDADGADYLVAGAVFPSASKPESTRWLGVDGLRAIVCTSRAPVLAIGGISAERMGAIAAAGAAGVAVIGLFSGAGGSVAALHQVVEEARRRFDSVTTAPQHRLQSPR